jgi:hypothetical protein
MIPLRKLCSSPLSNMSVHRQSGMYSRYFMSALIVILDDELCLGQHPTAVSPVNMLNWTGHPDAPPPVAEHADVIPFGHNNPGE